MNTQVARPQLLEDRSGALTEVERLKREVESLQGRLAKLNEASLGIAGSLEIDTVLQAVIDASRLLTDARYGAILTFDESGEIEKFITSGISSEERERMTDTPQGLGILGFLNEIEGPLRLADLASHPKSIGFPKNHLPIKNFLGIPMRREGAHLGSIYLAEKEGGGEFTPEDEEGLAMFASQGAASIANSRAYSTENRAKADLEALLDISPVAVMVFDAKTRELVSLNSEARRIVYGQPVPGYGLNELLRIMVLRRPNGQGIPLEELPTERAILSGETVRAEEIVVHLPDGKAVPVLCNATPIHNEDGEVVGVVATLQDMTPLEDLVRQRAEFLSMVTHELRNPLASIKGSVAALLGSPSSSLNSVDTRQFLQIIDQQADRMNGLLSNFLDMSPGTADASDYTEPPRYTVTFPANSAAGTTQIITIAINQDLFSEWAETFTVTLGTVAGDLASLVSVNPDRATATIAESDHIEVSISGPAKHSRSPSP